MGIVTLIYDCFEEVPAATNSVQVTWTLPAEVGNSIIFLKSYETTFTAPGHGCYDATLYSDRFTPWHVHAVRASRTSADAATTSTGSAKLDLRWDGLSTKCGGDVHLLIGRGDPHGSTGFTVTLNYRGDPSAFKLLNTTVEPATVVTLPALNVNRRPHFIKLVLEYNTEDWV